MNPVIICAVCNKPVEKLEWLDDFNSHARHITAHCHGDTDSMVLTDTFLMDLGGAKQLTEGVAFQTKKIAHDTYTQLALPTIPYASTTHQGHETTTPIPR